MSSKKPSHSDPRRPVVEELEPRLLLSADVSAVLVDAEPDREGEAVEPAAQVAMLEYEVAASRDALRVRRELVVIDPGVEDSHRLVEDIRASSDESRRLEVVVLDPKRDGVEQISEILEDYQNLDALHIVSHGNQGGVELGATRLDAESLSDHASAIAGWSDSLSLDADLLFYGCDLAGGGEGVALVESLRALTGADVAASTDETGHALLGGDWELEHHSGQIETELAISAEAQQAWMATLAAPIALDDALVAVQDTALVIDLANDVFVNDIDSDGDPLSLRDLTAPGVGTVVDNGDGTLTYTPGAGYTGTDSFDYIVTDGTDGTSHYWKLDGNGTDSVGTSHGAVTGTSVVPGHYGNALAFDEVGDHIVVPDFTYTDSFTISFRFKIDDNSGDQYHYIYSHGDVSSANNAVNVFLGEDLNANAGMLRTKLTDSNDSADAATLSAALEVDISSLIGDGQWHIYTLTVESGVGSKVYIDGALGNSSIYGGDAFDPATALNLGRREDADPDRYYGGQLDSVQIFDRDLSATEVADLHTGGFARGTVNLTVDPLNAAPVATDDPGLHSGLVSSLSPISYWRLGESAGAPTDIGSAGNTGSYQGVTLGQAGALNGDADTAVRFDGSDYVEIPHSAAYMIDEGAVQLWFKADSTGADQHLFSKDALGNVDGGHFSIAYRADGSVHWRLQSASSSYTLTSSPVSAGAWHHVLATFGPAGMQLFVDGVPAGNDPYTGGLGTSSGGTGNAEPLVIGASTQTSGAGVITPLEEYFTGEIDEVAIFGGQLTSDQAQDLYAAGLQDYTVAEDGSLTVSVAEGVLANDSDADGDPLTVALVSGPTSAASFTLNPDGSFTYTPIADFNGTDTFTYRADDGTDLSNVATVTITVSPVNDAPAATNLNAAETYTEDVVLDLADIVVSDVDGGSVTVTLTFSDVAAGSLSTATSGAVTSTFAGGVWTASGAIADVNALLTGVTFDPALDYNASFSIATSVSDGVAPAVTGSKLMTGNAVNDAPTAANLSALESYTEDTPLDLTNIVVSDVDSGTVTVTLTLSDAGAGSLSTGTSGAVTSTFAGGVWTASGAIADVNTLLAGVTFNPALDYNANFTIATSVSDGVAPAVTGSKLMTGNPVNDAPTATNLSAPESYTEDTPLDVTDIVVSDVDSGSVTVTLTLSDLAAGSLSTGTSGTVTSTFAGGVWTASGAIADVNTLLAGLTFTPALDYNADFTIATSVSDGVAPAVTGSKLVTGNPVNDAPTATNLSAPESYTEDTPLDLMDIVVSDVDSGSVTVTLTLSDPAAGSLSTGTSGAVTSTFAGGVWTASGAIADVNTLLAGVTFSPALDYNANFTIATSVSDGVAPAVTGSKLVTGNAINDAPTATNLSASESYTEDTPLDLTDIVVSDVDSGSVTVTLTLSDPAAGSLSTGTSGAVTSTFAGGVWTASGAIADVNALLVGVTFTPALDYNADFTIATSVSDGVAPAVTGSKLVTGNPVNDAPTATNLSAPESYTEDTPLDLTDIVVSDVDSGSVTVTLTLSDVLAGTLSTGTSGAVTSTFAGGVWTASGAIADVNTLLAGVTFTPALDYNADFTIATSVSDGVAPAVTGSKLVTGNAINDAPTATNLSAPESYTEDTPLDLTDIVVSDVDSGSVTVTLTLSDAAAGSLSTGTSGAVTSTFAGGVWTASGAIADVNTLLAGVTFSPALDYNANFTIATSVSDGVAPAVTGSKLVTGNPVNDAPTATNLSAPESYTEDTPLDLTDIVVSDVDSGSVTVTLTLSDVWAGTLSTGTSGAVTSTFAGGVWTASGAIADVNMLLAGVTFNPALDYSADFTIATSVSDGVAPAVTGSKLVTGNPVNDAPTATNLSAPESYTEDTPLDLANIVVSDVDSGSVTVTLTLSDPAAGSLSTGTSGAVTSTFAGGVWTASGAIADVNTLLAGVTFSPALDYNANFTIATSVSDGVAPAVTGSKLVTGNPVNDAPTATNLSAPESYTEDTPLDLTDIVVSDVDSGSVTVTLTLSDVAAGTLSTGTSGAVTSTFAGGVWTASGAIADVNTLLAGVTFTPALDYNADFTIATSVSDGVAPAVTGSKLVTGNPVNDAPTATNLSAPESYTEDTPLDLTDIVVSDVDSGSVTVTLTLSDLAAGSLSTGTSGAVTSTFAGGVWTASGAIADVNTLLAGATFNPALDYNANFTIATSVSDGVAPAVTGSKLVTGNPVNDAPTATNLSAPESYTEDTPLDLANIVVSDVDSGSVTVTLTLSDLAAGSLSTGTSGAVTSTFAGGVWTASGAIADVNALLAGVTFTPALDYNANFTIATSVSDGVAPAVTGSKLVTGNPVNDAPTATNLSAPESYTEDTPLDLTDIVVSDVDSGSVTVTLTLSDVAAGTLSTGTSGAVTSTFAGGVWTASGAIADVNTLLAGVTFTPALDYNANFTIATSVSDGVAPAVTGSKLVTGNPVNDAPTATNLSAPESYTEDTPLDLTNIVVSDVDSGSVTVTLTLSDAAAGSLSTGTSGVVTSTFAGGVWTASGAIAGVNTLLAGATFNPALGYNANFTIATSVSDGVAPAVTGSKLVTGNPVNDAPTATNLSAPESYTEDTPLDLTDIAVSDVDSGSVTVTLTLSDAAAGSLSTATSGAVTSTFAGGVWTASGAIADVNTLLAGATFNPALDYNANFTIATSVSDGVAPAVTGSKLVTGNPVNDAPTATNLSAPESYTEDTPLDLTDIAVSDVDSGSVTVTLTLSDAAAGSLSTATSGAVTSTFAGGVWTASGAIADVNTLLAGATFNPALGYNANFTIATSVSDGVAPAVTGSKLVTGNPVNDAPTATNLSAPESYTEDTPLDLTDIVVSDVDSGTVTVTLTLSDAAAGSLSTGTSGAVTSVFAGGVWTASGAIADVNTLLAGVTFTPALDYNANFTIATSVSDGVAPAVTGSKLVTGNPVNDAPTATNLSAPESYTEDTPLDLTNIVVSDVDSGSVTVTLTLSDAAAGSLSTGTSGAVTSTFAGGVWTASGAIADVNALLAGVTFTPALDYNANFTIATSVSDGVAPAVTGSKLVTGNPVNDAPTATNLSAPESYTEDTPLDLTNIVVSDVDSGSVTVTLTLSDAAAGSLSTGTSGAVTSTFAGGVWTASGAIADVNALLAGVTFTPALDYNANFTIATSVSDGVAPAVTGSKLVTGNPVNDAPTATNLSAPESYTEDTPLDLTDIVVSDVDSGSVTVTLTLSDVAAGTLSTGTSGAVTSTFAGGVWTASGAIADVNTLLAGVTFTPALDYNANFTIATSVSDGVAPAVTGSKLVTGNPVNDAPTATNLSAPESYTEDTPLDLTNIVVSDVDSGSVTVTLTLSDAAAGSLSTATSGAVTSTFAGGVWTASGAIADVNALLAGVTFTPALDYNANFTIATSVSDGVAPAVTGSKLVTGTAVNDAPLVNDQSLGPANENSPIGTLVGSVAASDVDAGQSLSYSITAGNTGGAFAIDAATGEISVASPGALDFEATPSFSLTVRVADDGVPVRSDTASITINLVDVNEAPAIADQLFSIGENQAVGASVGTVLASDVDAGQSLGFTITSGNTGGAFAIDSSSGEIRVANAAALDFETNARFDLGVEVRDDGAGTLSDSATVTIMVSDVNDSPVVTANQSFSAVEFTAAGTNIGAVLASDQDAGDSLTFRIIGGNSNGAFAIDPGTGMLSVASFSALDFQVNPSFALAVEVEDANGVTGSALVTIDLQQGADPTLDDGDPTDESEDDGGDEQAESLEVEAEDVSTTEPEASEEQVEAEAQTAPLQRPLEWVSQRPLQGQGSGIELESPTETQRSEPRTVELEHQSDSQRPIEADEEVYRLTALREQAMWGALDTLGDQIAHDADRREVETEQTRSRVEQVALALSAGTLALLARASSLTAMALSSLPVWQRVDPLSVLALSEKKRKERELELREAEDLEDRSGGGLGELLDERPDPDDPPSDTSQEEEDRERDRSSR